MAQNEFILSTKTISGWIFLQIFYSAGYFLPSFYQISLKDSSVVACRVENSVDPDQQASQIWIYIVLKTGYVQFQQGLG